MHLHVYWFWYCSTPTENIVNQQGDSPNAVVVQRHGDDHGSYYSKSKRDQQYGLQTLTWLGSSWTSAWRRNNVPYHWSVSKCHEPDIDIGVYTRAKLSWSRRSLRCSSRTDCWRWIHFRLKVCSPCQRWRSRSTFQVECRNLIISIVLCINFDPSHSFDSITYRYYIYLWDYQSW